MIEFNYDELKTKGSSSVSLQDEISLTVAKTSHDYTIIIERNDIILGRLFITTDYLFSFECYNRDGVYMNGSDYTMHGKLRTTSAVIDIIDSFAHELQYIAKSAA